MIHISHEPVSYPPNHLNEVITLCAACGKDTLHNPSDMRGLCEKSDLGKALKELNDAAAPIMEALTAMAEAMGNALSDAIEDVLRKKREQMAADKAKRDQERRDLGMTSGIDL